MARRVDLPLEELARRCEGGAPLRQLASDYRTSTGTVAGSVRAAARSLGLTRATARRRLHELRRREQQPLGPPSRTGQIGLRTTYRGLSARA